MPSKIIRFFWFLSSYTPLWIILCISNWPMLDAETMVLVEGSLLISVVCIVVSLISNAIVLWYLSSRQKKNKQYEGEIKTIKAISDLSREYIVTYAISLIGFNLMEGKDAISFTVLLAFFAFLYIKHDQIIYNPMLELFGYRLYEVSVVLIDMPKVGNHLVKEGTLISRRSIHRLKEAPVPFARMGNEDLFVEIKR